VPLPGRAMPRRPMRSYPQTDIDASPTTSRIRLIALRESVRGHRRHGGLWREGGLAGTTAEHWTGGSAHPNRGCALTVGSGVRAHDMCRDCMHPGTGDQHQETTPLSCNVRALVRWPGPGMRSASTEMEHPIPDPPLGGRLSVSPARTQPRITAGRAVELGQERTSTHTTQVHHTRIP